MYHDKDFDPPRGSYRLRCSERRRLTLGAVMARHDADDHPILVRNLSAEGFAAFCEAAVPIGTSFWLQLPGQPDLPAQVKWRRGGFIGCEFEHGLSVRTMLAILVTAG